MLHVVYSCIKVISFSYGSFVAILHSHFGMAYALDDCFPETRKFAQVCGHLGKHSGQLQRHCSNVKKWEGLLTSDHPMVLRG